MGESKEDAQKRKERKQKEFENDDALYHMVLTPV